MKPIAYLISHETIKERTIVSDNLNPKVLDQVVWDIQEQQIQVLLGTKLYNRLLTGVDQGNLKDKEKQLIDEYLTNVMLFLVLSELPIVLGYKFYNKNILKKTAENAEAATMSELADLMKHYKNKAEFFQERTIRWICDERAKDPALFTEYNDVQDIYPKRKGYRASIVL